MGGKLYISEDEYQSLRVQYQGWTMTSKYYEIDVDKISSIVDLITLFKAMYPRNLYIYENSPYYEDLKHLKKDEE